MVVEEVGKGFSCFFLKTLPFLIKGRERTDFLLPVNSANFLLDIFIMPK
jgi:hypothetical protein